MATRESAHVWQKAVQQRAAQLPDPPGNLKTEPAQCLRTSWPQSSQGQKSHRAKAHADKLSPKAEAATEQQA